MFNQGDLKSALRFLLAPALHPQTAPALVAFVPALVLAFAPLERRCRLSGSNLGPKDPKLNTLPMSPW